jgi:hypothetical protein
VQQWPLEREGRILLWFVVGCCDGSGELGDITREQDKALMLAW